MRNKIFKYASLALFLGFMPCAVTTADAAPKKPAPKKAVRKAPSWMKFILTKKSYNVQTHVISISVKHVNNSDNREVKAIFDKNMTVQVLLYEKNAEGIPFFKEGDFKVNFASTNVNKVELYPAQSQTLTYKIKVVDKAMIDKINKVMATGRGMIKVSLPVYDCRIKQVAF